MFIERNMTADSEKLGIEKNGPSQSTGTFHTFYTWKYYFCARKEDEEEFTSKYYSNSPDSLFHDLLSSILR